MSERPGPPLSILAWGLVAAVLIEFLLLRTTTRALIHIPGLERFEIPIGWLAETGRFAYYLSVMLLLAILVLGATRLIRSDQRRDTLAGSVIAVFLAMALAGRVGLVTWVALGWASLGLLVAITALSWRGMRSIPLAFFVFSSIAAGSSVLGQGDGGGLSGVNVDLLVLAAEVGLVLAAITSPLLVEKRLTPSSLIAGGAVTLVTAGALVAGGSTLSIIILWNVGVPGWLPGITYALALGALTATVWLASSSNKPATGIGIVLLIAGGVGVISTYQTGLVFAGLLFVAGSLHNESSLEDAGPDTVVLEPQKPVVVTGG